MVQRGEMTASGPPRRIEAQKPAQQARSQVQFCYLCGEQLSTPMTREHVVPTALLGDPPRDERDRWAIILNVHRECEAQAKQQKDAWLKLATQMHTAPQEDWHDGHMRAMPLRPALVQNPETDSYLTVLSGFELLQYGVWNWVRGLHAALYQQFLPHDTRHDVFAPVPTGDAKGFASLVDREKTTAMTRALLERAVRQHEWDGVTAWGGVLQYKCVWSNGHSHERIERSLCGWSIDLPTARAWSKTVMRGGAVRPWQGAYVLEKLPGGASTITYEDSAADKNDDQEG